MNISLKDIQSNVVGYHHKENIGCLFLRFEKNESKVLKWIQSIVDAYVTNAQDERNAYLKYKEDKITNSDASINFSLSSEGLRFFNFTENKDKAPSDPAFWKGMHMRSAILNDPLLMHRERNFRKNYHAMIMVAHDDKTEVREFITFLIEDLKHHKIHSSFHVEEGGVLYNELDQKIEHFGYRDGLSKIKFFDSQNKLIPEKAELVLDDHGSYMVFRKLEQNVKKFNQNIRKRSDEMKIPIDYMYARAVGRFKDGQSLTEINKPSNKSTAPELVDFSKDKKGTKCPFHSHIRKSNPRTEDVKIHRIGMPYGPHFQTSEPETGVGMLFVCMQKSIVDQFEKIQCKWMNDENFPAKESSGIDPIAGQHKPAYLKSGFNNIVQGSSRTRSEASDINGAVKFLGGDYFFTPKISWFKHLGKYLKSVPPLSKPVYKAPYSFKNSYSVKKV